MNKHKPRQKEIYRGPPVGIEPNYSVLFMNKHFLCNLHTLVIVFRVNAGIVLCIIWRIKGNALVFEVC